MSHPQPTDVAAAEVNDWRRYAPGNFQEIGRIGRIAIGLLGLSTLTHLLSMWSVWNTYGVVNRYLGGEPNVADADLTRAETIARLTSVPNLVISVAVAVVLVLWLYRARVNSEVFCQAGHRHIHGSVLAGWFSPGPNLWYPMQIGDDVWTASHPATPSWADDMRPKRRIMATTVACWVAMVLDIVGRLLLGIDGPAGPVGISLHAAWQPTHHGAATISCLATRLREFCITRYGEQVTPSHHDPGGRPSASAPRCRCHGPVGGGRRSGQ